MTFDPAAAFGDEFGAEVHQQEIESGYSLERWRAAGRKSKEWPDKENQAWWKHHGPGMVQAYIDWRLRTPWEIATFAGARAVEIALTPSFRDVLVKMFLDRVFVTDTGELIVVDIKTGSRTPDSNLQLGMYAAGMELVLGVRPTWGAYFMARKGGELTPPVDLDRYTPDYIHAELSAFLRGVGALAFPSKVGSHCIACGVNDSCPAYSTEATLDEALYPTIEMLGDLPAHVSYSAFNSYLYCPRQYLLTRVLHVPERPAWYLAGGKAVHSATEQYDHVAEAASQGAA